MDGFGWWLGGFFLLYNYLPKVVLGLLGFKSVS